MVMTMVARALERIGDNAVGVGEQVIFVETGLFRKYPIEPLGGDRRRRSGVRRRVSRAAFFRCERFTVVKKP